MCIGIPSQGGCDVVLLFLRVIPAWVGGVRVVLDNPEHLDGNAGQVAGELARNIVSSVGEFGYFDSFQAYSGRLYCSPAGCVLEA